MRINMGRPTRITLDLAALHHNLLEIRKRAPRSAILAMVKSNAYGHGIERIALALQKADALGVACIEEGLLLREIGVKNPIVLMEGLFHSNELKSAVEKNFTLVVHHQAQVEMLEKDRVSTPLKVWLKVNTGMHRLGFQPQEVKSIYQRLQECPAVQKPIGLMTHFAQSDSEDASYTLQQIEKFNAATLNLPGPRSLANSAGIMAFPVSHEDWVRPGIMLYGASPFRKKKGQDYHLKPVMSLSSALIAIHKIVKGDKVGYGGVFHAPRDMLLGVVGIGYGDGYPQYTQEGTPILVNGKVCPLVGRVSMDMLTVDISRQPQAKVGDPVILWGKDLPVEQVAENNHTSAYELLTRITQRVHVKIINAGRG